MKANKHWPWAKRTLAAAVAIAVLSTGIAPAQKGGKGGGKGGGGKEEPTAFSGDGTSARRVPNAQ